MRPRAPDDRDGLPEPWSTPSLASYDAKPVASLMNAECLAKSEAALRLSIQRLWEAARAPSSSPSAPLMHTALMAHLQRALPLMTALRDESQDTAPN